MIGACECCGVEGARVMLLLMLVIENRGGSVMLSSSSCHCISMLLMLSDALMMTHAVHCWSLQCIIRMILISMTHR